MRGFSLVELSIVLVILGLLTGGILGGQALIRAAELRSVSTEYSRWVTATQTFRDKYFALPGDMPNAIAFWGAADTSGAGGNCGSPFTNAGTGTQTCNGNGNGMVGYSSSNQTAWNETHRFWQHLASAGLIEGTYTGIASDGNYGNAPGTNVPRPKVRSTACWAAFRHRNPGEVAADGSGILYDNVFQLGGATIFNCSLPIFQPEEAWNVDTKMDDGMPRQGRTVTWQWGSNCNTATAVSDLNATYQLNQSGNNCSLMFIRLF